MKAFFKKIALPTLALVIALCAGLAGCDNKTPEDPTNDKDTTQEPQNITYTVTGECEEGILGGLKAQLKNGTTVAAESTFDKKSGVATFSLPAATYTVDIVEKAGFEGFLEGYRWSMASVTPESPNAKITILSADDDDDDTDTEKVTYTLTLLYPDNKPASGVMVQLCGGPNELCNPKKTDEKGVAVFELAAGKYEVHIAQVDWPSGYTFDDKKYTMDAAGGSLTVYLQTV